MKKAAILHTTQVTLNPLKALAERLMPQADLVHILDDSILKEVMANGGPTKAVNSRIAHYVQSAEESGCEVFMSACSSIGESLEQCRFLTSMLLLRIDESMAEQAVTMGKHIGIMATVLTTLSPTANLIQSKGRELGQEVQVEQILLSNAYKALLNGEPEKHDSLILSGIEQLMDTSDVIVLAQASMARVIEKLKVIRKPILTSPELGMKRLLSVIGLPMEMLQP